MFSRNTIPTGGGLLEVHRSQSVRRAKVITDGDGLVSHVGAGLLAELADRSGLNEGLWVASRWRQAPAPLVTRSAAGARRSACG